MNYLDALICISIPFFCGLIVFIAIWLSEKYDQWRGDKEFEKWRRDNA